MEKYNNISNKDKCEKGETPSDLPNEREKDEAIILRPLNIQDLKETKNQVNPSFWLGMWNLKNMCKHTEPVNVKVN
jgi:hypothetical protein